jgi:hypothetical protein
MTTNTGTFSRHWIAALPLVVLFAIGSTVANAQTIRNGPICKTRSVRQHRRDTFGW